MKHVTPSRPLLLVRARERDAEVGSVGAADEVLRPVEDPVVAVAMSGRLDRAGRIAAARRLGQGEEASLLAPRASGRGSAPSDRRSPRTAARDPIRRRRRSTGRIGRRDAVTSPCTSARRSPCRSRDRRARPGRPGSTGPCPSPSRRAARGRRAGSSSASGSRSASSGTISRADEIANRLDDHALLVGQARDPCGRS